MIFGGFHSCSKFSYMTLLEHMIESHPILENSFRMDSFIEVLKKNNKRTNLLKAFVLSYLSLSLSSNSCVFSGVASKQFL
jgi:hypothetical protein